MLKRILIDADACPVTDIAIDIAYTKGLECIILCDDAHFFSREGVQTITVMRGADSVDFRLTNMANASDIVITQDYGLAAMCLSKKAIVLNQDGLVYNNQNIEGLLFFRHESKKARMAGKHIKGKSKRTKEQDDKFKNALLTVLEEDDA